MLYKEKEIVEWASNRGILEVGDRLAQGLKTVTEVAELIDNVQKGNSPMDDIGDIYVTIVVQAAMNGTSIHECLEENAELPASSSIAIQLAEMVLDCGMMLEYTYPEETVDTVYLGVYIANIYCGLEQVCNYFRLNMDDCVDLSYDIITKRSGKMKNGVFVKDS